jgi:hypothetical protein
MCSSGSTHYAGKTDVFRYELVVKVMGMFWGGRGAAD